MFAFPSTGSPSSPSGLYLPSLTYNKYPAAPYPSSKLVGRIFLVSLSFLLGFLFFPLFAGWQTSGFPFPFGKRCTALKSRPTLSLIESCSSLLPDKREVLVEKITSQKLPFPFKYLFMILSAPALKDTVRVRQGLHRKIAPFASRVYYYWSFRLESPSLFFLI